MPVLDGLVEAGFPEWAEQFDFGAKVHDDLEASGLGEDGRTVHVGAVHLQRVQQRAGALYERPSFDGQQ